MSNIYTSKQPLSIYGPTGIDWDDARELPKVHYYLWQEKTPFYP